MMGIVEGADQDIGFLDAAMVRPPVKALLIGLWMHAAHVGATRRHCERGIRR
jgi:hypothetical protein